MNSIEKITRFKETLIRTDEEFDGVLGALQGLVAIAELKGEDIIAASIDEDPAVVDDQLLGVIGFVLWLRSDDAPPVELDDLKQMPAVIAELAAAAGIA